MQLFFVYQYFYYLFRIGVFVYFFSLFADEDCIEFIEDSCHFLRDMKTCHAKLRNIERPWGELRDVFEDVFMLFNHLCQQLLQLVSLDKESLMLCRDKEYLRMD